MYILGYEPILISVSPVGSSKSLQSLSCRRLSCIWGNSEAAWQIDAAASGSLARSGKLDQSVAKFYHSVMKFYVHYIRA